MQDSIAVVLHKVWKHGSEIWTEWEKIETRRWSHAVKMETCNQIIHMNKEQSSDKLCFSFLFNVSERGMVFFKKIYDKNGTFCKGYDRDTYYCS